MGTSNCPSSVPEQPNSRLFGIVEGTVSAPRVTYLPSPQPITPQLLTLADPVEPTEVFRFAADCLEQGCQYFGQGQCQLVRRIVNGLPAVTSDLPPCPIRRSCRWWQQAGKVACLRCPQIVRIDYAMSEATQTVIRGNDETYSHPQSS